jgi:choline-sulfatase
VNATPVSQVSFSATITDLCGVKQIAKNDGVSFASLVREPEVKQSYGPVFAEYSLNNSHAKAMIRDGNLKYTYWTHDTPELYDLSADPEELRNLVNDAAHAGDVARLKAELFAWHKPDSQPVA